MNDLEATASRGQAAVPISSIATGKLRALGGASLFTSSDGLVDAFAEVFARMAATSAPQSETRHEYAADDPGMTARDETLSDAELSDPEPVVGTDDDPDVDAERRPDVAVALSAETDLVLHDEEPELSLGSDQPEVEEAVSIDPASTAAASEIVVSQEEIEAIELTTQPEVRSSAADRDRGESAVATATQGREPIAGQYQANPGAAESATLPEDEQEIGDIAEPSEENQSGRSARRSHRRDRRDQDSSGEGTRPVSSAGKADSKAVESSVISAGSSDAESDQADQRQDTSASPATRRSNSAATVEHVLAASQSKVPSSARGPLGRSTAGGADRSTIGATESTSATRAEPAGKTDAGKAHNRSTADTVSRIKLIQRVSKAFQHLGADGGVVRLRLAPAELGSVRVEMRIQQRKVEARVVADTEAASAALREHLPELRLRLESYGMQVEKIEVETELSQGNSQFGSDADSGGQSDRQQQRSPRGLTPSAVRTTSPSHHSDRPVDLAAAVSAGVDVRL